MKRIFCICCIFFGLLFSGCRSRDNYTETTELKNDSDVQREVFNIEKYPALLAVGKLKLIGQRFCSLILVAEDVAVTAGHCFLESNVKFDLTQDLNPAFAKVIFKTRDGERIENVSVKRILIAESKPDYAVVRLTKKISKDQIVPLKILNLPVIKMFSMTDKLGCAGFNGDKQGDGGELLTICRHIKIFADTSSKHLIDTNCISFYGGSGGLFFEEKDAGEFDVIGVIWGMTDEKFNEKGELVKDENISTQITPVSVFFEKLNNIIAGKSDK